MGGCGHSLRAVAGLPRDPHARCPTHRQRRVDPGCLEWGRGARAWVPALHGARLAVEPSPPRRTHRLAAQSVLGRLRRAGERADLRARAAHTARGVDFSRHCEHRRGGCDRRAGAGPGPHRLDLGDRRRGIHPHPGHRRGDPAAGGGGERRRRGAPAGAQRSRGDTGTRGTNGIRESQRDASRYEIRSTQHGSRITQHAAPSTLHAPPRSSSLPSSSAWAWAAI